MGILDLERWRSLPGFSGYEISSKGNVRRYGRPVKHDGMVTVGSRRIDVANLVQQMFDTIKHNTGGFRRMFLLKKGWYRPPGVITAGGFKPGP